MGGDDFDDLLLGGAEGALEVSSGRQVTDLPLPLRKRLVRDVLEQVLEEAVLTPLGRARVGLDRQELLARQRGQEQFELGLVQSGQCGEAGLGEGPAEHRGVLEQATLLGLESVQPRGDQRVECFRDGECFDRPRRAVDIAFALEETAVEKHADGLDGVERHALRSVEDLGLKLLLETRDEAVEQLLHRPLGKRLERQRGGVPAGRPEVGPAFQQVRPGEHQHEDAMVARPLEQVLDEIEERRIRPVHVFEDEDGRAALGEALEEDAPGREEVVPLMRLPLGQAQEVGETGLDPVALLLVFDVGLGGLAELLPSGPRVLALGDLRPHPDHLGERPVRDAFAVGEAAAALPRNQLFDSVDVLAELPGQPGLAEAGDADHRHEVGLGLIGAGVEHLLDDAELSLTPDVGRLEASGLERAAAKARYA